MACVRFSMYHGCTGSAFMVVHNSVQYDVRSVVLDLENSPDSRSQHYSVSFKHVLYAFTCSALSGRFRHPTCYLSPSSVHASFYVYITACEDGNTARPPKLPCILFTDPQAFYIAEDSARVRFGHIYLSSLCMRTSRELTAGHKAECMIWQWRRQTNLERYARRQYLGLSPGQRGRRDPFEKGCLKSVSLIAHAFDVPYGSKSGWVIC